MKNYIKNVITNGNIVQKVFLVLFLLNTIVGLFWVFTSDVDGEHVKKQYFPEKRGTLYVNQNDDVIIGIGEDKRSRCYFYNYTGDEELCDYTNFGLTYQEFLVWLFSGIFLFFTMYIYKSLVFKEVLIWILVGSVFFCVMYILNLDFLPFLIFN